MKRLQEQTLYEVLEVSPSAPALEIESAFARAKALYGPGSLATYTLMAPEEADALTGRIEEAGRVLLDAAARAQYDAALSAGAAAGAAPPAAPEALPQAAAAVNGEAPVIIPALSIARVVFGDDEPAGEDEELEADDAPGDEVESARETAEAELPGVLALPEPVATPAPPALAAAPPTAPIALVVPAARLLAQAAEAGGPAESAATPIRTPIPLRNEVAPPAEPAPIAPTPTPTPAPIATAPARAAPEPPCHGPVIVPDGTAWTGDILRQIREARGLSLQVLADRTKVTRHHIENIEGDRFDRLPAAVYLRGILMTLARELRLDGQKVAKSYLERAGAGAGRDGGLPIPRR